MTKERVNMFEKAHEDRRQQFVEENDHVAKEIVLSPEEDVDNTPTDINKSNGNFLLKENRKKTALTTRVDKNIVVFIDELHKLTGASKTDIINQFLIYAIMNQDDLTEIRSQNKKIQNIFDKFVNS